MPFTNIECHHRGHFDCGNGMLSSKHNIIIWHFLHSSALKQNGFSTLKYSGLCAQSSGLHKLRFAILFQFLYYGRGPRRRPETCHGANVREPKDGYIIPNHIHYHSLEWVLWRHSSMRPPGLLRPSFSSSYLPEKISWLCRIGLSQRQG